MSDLRENLKTEFQEPEYRYGYAESFLNTKLATQIKTLREQRDKTQADAAALMGIKQPGYRRFEDVNHSVWKTDSLWNIARAYGVRLDISFKTFGSLLDDKEHFNKEALKLPAFEEDPAFKEPPVEESGAEKTAAVTAQGMTLKDLFNPTYEQFVQTIQTHFAGVVSKIQAGSLGMGTLQDLAGVGSRRAVAISAGATTVATEISAETRTAMGEKQPDPYGGLHVVSRRVRPRHANKGEEYGGTTRYARARKRA